MGGVALCLEDRSHVACGEYLLDHRPFDGAKEQDAEGEDVKTRNINSGCNAAWLVQSPSSVKVAVPRSQANPPEDQEPDDDKQSLRQMLHTACFDAKKGAECAWVDLHKRSRCKSQ